MTDTPSPYLIMLIGLPGTGKSTFRNNFLKHNIRDWVILSSDDYIEWVAQKANKTYSEVFRFEAKNAESNLLSVAKSAILSGKNCLWDQTNLSEKSRKKRLDMFPKTYTTFGHIFHPPGEEKHKKILANRPEKFIPWSIIENMKSTYQTPSNNDFHHIRHHNFEER